MGRWAEGLFQGDFDLDEACDISKDAGIELYSYEIDPEDPDNRGKGLEATREHLNRVLDGLYEKYINMNPKHLFFGKELRLVFLTALAMRVGATINPKYMALLKNTYTKIRVSPKYSLPLFDSGFRGPGKMQFEQALRRYKNNGTPWDFDVDRCGAESCGKTKSELREGQIIKLCAKCKEVCYCSKECQSEHWPAHKKTCKKPSPSPWGPMMLNV